MSETAQYEGITMYGVVMDDATGQYPIDFVETTGGVSTYLGSEWPFDDNVTVTGAPPPEVGSFTFQTFVTAGVAHTIECIDALGQEVVYNFGADGSVSAVPETGGVTGIGCSIFAITGATGAAGATDPTGATGATGPTGPGVLAQQISNLLGGSLVGSPEAAADLSNIYEAVLGRAPDPTGLADFEQYLASGGSLAGVEASVANSPEAAADLSNIYQAEPGRAPDPAGLADFEQYLASGGSLAGVEASVANSPEAAADLSSIYEAELGQATDPGVLANYQQYLATGGSLVGVVASVGGSSGVKNPLAVLTTKALGQAPTAGQLAFGQLQLDAGQSLAVVSAQTVQLASSPTFVPSTGGQVTGPMSGTGVFEFGPGTFGQNEVTNFDPSRDLLQLSQTQFGNFAAVQAAEQPTAAGLLITCNTTNSILLDGVTAAQLTAANVTFV